MSEQDGDDQVLGGRLDKSQASYFLRRLRWARLQTQNDAEDFREICFVLEELATAMFSKKQSSLGGYKDDYKNLFKLYSCQDERIYNFLVSVHLARNDISHHGAFARAAASKAQLLAIEIEGIILSELTLLGHIMSESVVYAQDYYTIAKLREIMLSNSFSYLPYKRGREYYLISDSDLARLWNKKWDKVKKDNDKIRNQKLYIDKLTKLIETKDLTLTEKAGRIPISKSIEEEQDKLSTRPLLVTKGRAVVGIVTAFDWL